MPYPAASMDQPQQDAPKPFVAGLPDAPLERPSDFPDYDGPLVCPFYGPDHPARRDEESKEAFNEDVARVAFGDAIVDAHARVQLRAGFRGDWWFLITLLWGSTQLATLSAEQWQNELAIHARAWEKTRVGPDVIRHLEHAHLKHTDLRHAMLERAHLERAMLDHARLEHAHMNHARLAGAHMLDTHLDAAQLFAADLSAAHMGHAHLARAFLSRSNMTRAYLHHANATHAQLHDAVLTGARLEDANMQHADLTAASLAGADLRRTNFNHATLSGSLLTGSNLHEANLDGANLRWARGLLFDDNPVRRLDIQGTARDPWSTLRRTYTGPMFFVHLLLLIAFLLPYAAKVITLTTTARGYDALRQSLEGGEGVPPGGDMVRAWLENFDASHAQTNALWVLLGGTHAWWPLMVATAVCVLAYNALRGYLTLTVGVLRDQADRVERTPSIEEYMGQHHEPVIPTEVNFNTAMDTASEWASARWARLHPATMNLWTLGLRKLASLNLFREVGPWRLHQLARVLFWISIASVILHVGSWLWTTTVPVPK